MSSDGLVGIPLNLMILIFLDELMALSLPFKISVDFICPRTHILETDDSSLFPCPI